MMHLLRLIRRRVGPTATCVLLIAGAGTLLGAGSAQAATTQAAACPGTPVVAGTTCADTGTLTFTAGTLTLTSPTALTWAGVGTGIDMALADTTTAHQSYIVNDATGSGAGWNVTVSSTTFTTGTITLPLTGTFSTNGNITSQTAVTAPTGACTSGATCTLPTNTTTYPVLVTNAATTPPVVKIYDTSAATGVGSITVGLPGANPVGWWVSLLANAKPGTYTSTVTLGVVSAP